MDLKEVPNAEANPPTFEPTFEKNLKALLAFEDNLEAPPAF